MFVVCTVQHAARAETSIPVNHPSILLPSISISIVQLVIELVLGTDMKSHFTIISHFSTNHRLGNTSLLHKTKSHRSTSLASSAGEGHDCVSGRVGRYRSKGPVYPVWPG